MKIGNSIDIGHHQKTDEFSANRASLHKNQTHEYALVPTFYEKFPTEPPLPLQHPFLKIDQHASYFQALYDMDLMGKKFIKLIRKQGLEKDIVFRRWKREEWDVLMQYLHEIRLKEFADKAEEFKIRLHHLREQFKAKDIQHEKEKSRIEEKSKLYLEMQLTRYREEGIEVAKLAKQLQEEIKAIVKKYQEDIVFYRARHSERAKWEENQLHEIDAKKLEYTYFHRDRIKKQIKDHIAFLREETKKIIQDEVAYRKFIYEERNKNVAELQEYLKMMLFKASDLSKLFMLYRRDAQFEHEHDLKEDYQWFVDFLLKWRADQNEFYINKKINWQEQKNHFFTVHFQILKEKSQLLSERREDQVEASKAFTHLLRLSKFEHEEKLKLDNERVDKEHDFKRYKHSRLLFDAMIHHRLLDKAMTSILWAISDREKNLEIILHEQRHQHRLDDLELVERAKRLREHYREQKNLMNEAQKHYSAFFDVLILDKKQERNMVKKIKEHLNEYSKTFEVLAEKAFYDDIATKDEMKERIFDSFYIKVFQTLHDVKIRQSVAMNCNQNLWEMQFKVAGGQLANSIATGYHHQLRTSLYMPRLEVENMPTVKKVLGNRFKRVKNGYKV